MLTYPEISPVLLDLGPVQVRWYGLMYLVGFVGAWWLAVGRARRFPDWGWKPQEIGDILFYAALGVVLGGRLGYMLFYDFGNVLNDPLRIVRVWEGGMSFHGGFLGVLCAGWLYGRHTGRTFFQVMDFVAPVVPLGLFAGRIGNFINGELWGAPTTMPWGMKVSCGAARDLCRYKLELPAGTPWTPPLHPSQLYEAGLEGIVLFVLLWWYSSLAPPVRAVSGVFLIAYGSFRFLVEFIRMPDAQLGYLAFDWLTMGQLLSAPMILFGVLLLALAYRKPA